MAWNPLIRKFACLYCFLCLIQITSLKDLHLICIFLFYKLSIKLERFIENTIDQQQKSKDKKKVKSKWKYVKVSKSK